MVFVKKVARDTAGNVMFPAVVGGGRVWWLREGELFSLPRPPGKPVPLRGGWYEETAYWWVDNPQYPYHEEIRIRRKAAILLLASELTAP